MRFVSALLLLPILLSPPYATANELAQLFCDRIDLKLSSVSRFECLGVGLEPSGQTSVNGTPIFYRDYAPKGEPVAKVLLIGGTHGDEYSSVSVVFKWLTMLRAGAGENYHWRVVPVLNPDGLLRPHGQSRRMNANGVDINRNFPTPNWAVDAKEYWEQRTRYNKRRYPGPGPASEPETKYIVEQMKDFSPDAVISVHAPHGVIDYDGPKTPPKNLGPLDLLRLGTYPGSMGRYIGLHMDVPLLTVELESATSMPSKTDIKAIWLDTVAWLDKRIREKRPEISQQQKLTDKKPSNDSDSP